MGARQLIGVVGHDQYQRKASTQAEQDADELARAGVAVLEILDHQAERAAECEPADDADQALTHAGAALIGRIELRADRRGIQLREARAKLWDQGCQVVRGRPEDVNKAVIGHTSKHIGQGKADRRVGDPAPGRVATRPAESDALLPSRQPATSSMRRVIPMPSGPNTDTRAGSPSAARWRAEPKRGHSAF